METSSRLSFIWVRLVILRPCGGLKIFMLKLVQGDPFPEITLLSEGYFLSISRVLAG
jgi:hypothetical protein